ncbi:MAG: ATP-binding protein [Geminicoccaceae bacterium]
MPFRQLGGHTLRSALGGGGMRVPEPERRQLTVMFCDLVGSTALSRQMDPEDLLDVLRSFRDTSAEIIGEHDGYVSRYLGDGFLALFGYPSAHEDDAERAAHAGLAIAEAVSQLRIARHDDLRLAVRVGMATGLVIAGEVIGEGHSREEAIIGETPNLASRLQNLAVPNTVVIADSTRRLLRDAFEYRSLGKHTLKGFNDPVQAWRIVGMSDVETRFDAAQTSGLAPLINREAELDLMYRLWTEVKTSSSRVLLLGGDAGIGKSRLIKALRDRIASEEHSALQFQCSQHHRYTALHPFLRHIERTAGFEREDSANTKREKLHITFGEKALPVYERLLSLQVPRTDDNVVEFNPKRQRELTFATILQRMHTHAEDLPLLVVVEDAHWMDPTSIELLNFLFDRAEKANVLFLVTFRPEFTPVWADRANATTVTLEALDSESGKALAQTVLGDDAASPQVVAEIVERTEGMPLFIEELAKSLLESGSLRTKRRRRRAAEPPPLGTVPISLMDSLMARIDQLGEAKTIAQIGAVIGQEFTHALLERVVHANEPDLQTALPRLVSSGLLLKQDSAKQTRYVFKHALVRDAAYNSLLRRRRETLHARIAACLEDHFPDIVATVPELLAEHYSEAGLAERAIRYWQRAGERASERSEILEAENHFTNALQLLNALQESSIRKEIELSLLVGLGPVEIAIGGPGSKGSNDCYERAVALCGELPNSPLHFAAHWGQWRTSRTYQIKRERADNLSAVTANLGDPGLSLQAHHCQWAVLFNLGSHETCCTHVKHGVELYEAGDYRSHALIYGGHDPAVCGHGQAALSLWLLGRPEQALACMERALAVASSLGHAGSTLHGTEIASMFHRFRQDVDEVEQLAERMIKLSRAEEFAALEAKGELFRSWTEGRRGDVDRAIAGLGSGIETLRSIDASEDLPFFFDMLAECCALGRRVDQGLRALDSAFQEVEKTASRFWTAELHRRRGELLLLGQGNDAEAEAAFKDALKTAREQNARMLELRAATSYAAWLKNRGGAEAATSLLSSVYTEFTEGLDSVDLVAARNCLKELGAGSGPS